MNNDYTSNEIEIEAFLAYDDGALAEVPQALAAYVDQQQHYVS